MKKLFLLAICCVSFGSMHARGFMTSVELVMKRVVHHSDAQQTNYVEIESKLAARSCPSGYGRLFVLTTEILDGINAAPGIRVADLMQSFVFMAGLYEDEKIKAYLYAHGAVPEAVLRARAKAGEALEEVGQEGEQDGKEEDGGSKPVIKPWVLV
jgi:hypothetical protein